MIQPPEAFEMIYNYYVDDIDLLYGQGLDTHYTLSRTIPGQSMDNI